ncbi:hypothetical protein AB2876_23210, partial [Escherichia coli]
TTYLVDTTLSNSSDSDQTVQAVRLRIEDADVTFLCNTVVFDGEELHASYYQSLLSQVRDMVDAL